MYRSHLDQATKIKKYVLFIMIICRCFYYLIVWESEIHLMYHGVIINITFCHCGFICENQINLKLFHTPPPPLRQGVTRHHLLIIWAVYSWLVSNTTPFWYHWFHPHGSHPRRHSLSARHLSCEQATRDWWVTPLTSDVTGLSAAVFFKLTIESKISITS